MQSHPLRTAAAGILALAALGLETPAARAAFDAAILDGPQGIAQATSIAIDAADNVHVAYFSTWSSIPPEGLKYAVLSGGAWSIEFVDSTFEHSAQSNEVSLAIDGADNIHIAYFAHSANTMRYALKSGGVWTIEDLGDSWSSDYIALDVDSAGDPHIVYYATGGVEWGAVVYARKTAGSWGYEAVPNPGGGGTGVHCDIAVDSNDVPHVSYIGFDGGVFYTNRSSGWVPDQLVAADVNHAAIAIDSQNRPHIAYHDFNTSLLGYALLDGGSWSLETPDSITTSGQWPCIAIDGNDDPHIAYFRDEAFDKAMYATKSGGGWTTEVAGTEVSGEVEDISGGTEIAVDGQGRPHVLYHEGTWADVWYAVLAPTTGIGIGAPAEVPLSLIAFPNPLPAGESVSIRYAAGANRPLSLDVLDVSGRRVRPLAAGRADAGVAETLWDGRDTGGRLVATGAYFLRLHDGAAAQTAKILLVR